MFLYVFQESLATVYATCCPAQYTIYEPVIRLKGQAKSVPSQRPFSSKEVQSNLPDPHYLKMLQPLEYKGLQGILHEIGGTGSFVFLFARVRENYCVYYHICYDRLSTSYCLDMKRHYNKGNIHNNRVCFQIVPSTTKYCFLAVSRIAIGFQLSGY